jgi:hypothetical protein
MYGVGVDEKGRSHVARRFGLSTDALAGAAQELADVASVLRGVGPVPDEVPTGSIVVASAWRLFSDAIVRSQLSTAAAVAELASSFNAAIAGEMNVDAGLDKRA